MHVRRFSRFPALVSAVVLALSAVTLAAACKRDDPDAKPDDTSSKSKKPKTPPKPSRVPAEHRAAHTACDRADTPAPTTVTHAARMVIPEGPACASKSDCTESPNGRCAAGHCTYDGCYEDKDCGKGVCTCSQEGKRGWYCKPGDCSVDGDCGSGYCSPSVSITCGSFFGVVGFYCRTAEDECVDDGDCTKDKQGGYCAFDDKAKHWRCGYGRCVGANALVTPSEG